MYLKAYIQNLVANDQMVSEKSIFLFSYVNDLGLDLDYPFTFINSIGCLHLLAFWSQAAVLSEKSTVFL